MGHPPSTKISPSESPMPKPSDLYQPSRKDLASLQQYLDRDFQNFWDVRRFGAHLGLRIKCAVCGGEPPKQRANEDFFWYGYRKWRWLANHMVSDHLRSQALVNRRIRARESRIQVAAIKKSERRAA